MTVESPSQTQKGHKGFIHEKYSYVLSKSTMWNLQIMNGLWISWQWSLTDESLSPTQRGIGFTLEWIFGFALISLYFDFPTLYFPYTMISLYFDFPTLISLDYDFPLHSWHSYKYGLSLVVLTEILESWSRRTN